MSRDGLLPKIFSRIHPRFGTPSFSTILTGFAVAIPALFLNLDVVIALTSIGTLFAFVLVCGGVLVLQNHPGRSESRFKVPYVNGKYIVPVLLIGSMIFIGIKVPGYFAGLMTLETLPVLGFYLVAVIIAVLSYIKNFSLIPVLGMLSCFYLMAQEHHSNWLRFLIWLGVGLIIYFLYGYRNSKLANKES